MRGMLFYFVFDVLLMMLSKTLAFMTKMSMRCRKLYEDLVQFC